MQDTKWLETGLSHIWLPYTQMHTAPTPVPVTSTKGATIELADGRKLVDGVGSWWTCVHGYNHPKLKAALIAQLEQMPHIMLGGLAHESAYTLAARLAEITPGDLSRVFFSESGSVSVEVAMKVAVQYWRNLKGENRPKFVAFRGGYHGDTFATMSVCDPDEGMHAFFGDALADQYILDLPDTSERAEALDTCLQQNKDIAAVLVEPLIQGAGGMRMQTPETLQTMREICTRNGVLLIFDEIFTGFGRTGEMFAADRASVTPDIMTLGKALTGGITPLSATVVSENIYAAFDSDDFSKALQHGPTFTGHALACAVAHAAIDLIEETGALNKVKQLERDLLADLSTLASHPNVKDVRVMGAVAAVEVIPEFDLEAVRAAFIDKGVFIRPIGQVFYLSPSYTLTAEERTKLTSELSEMVAILE